MLKVISSSENEINKLRCGEIFCLTSTIYKANCLFCDKEIEFEEFPKHFQNEHATKLFQTKAADNDAEQTLLRDIKRETMEFLQIPPENDEIDGEKLISIADLKNLNEVVDQKPIQIFAELEDVEHKIDNDGVGDGDGDRRNDMDCADNCDWKNDDDDISDDSDSKMNSLQTPTNVVISDNDKPYSCTKCPRTYKHQKSLKQHIRIQHEKDLQRKATTKNKDPKFVCGECGKSFNKEAFLLTHQLNHTGIICDICGKTFKQVGNLKQHKIRHTGIRNFKCNMCSKTFFRETELRFHVIKHTQSLPFVCEICGKSLRHGKLKSHMRRHTGERPAKCDKCGKSFFDNHDLNVHLTSHSDARPFSCDICGSSFRHKKALRVHKKIHNKNCNHKCKICDKAYAQSAGLTAHMRTHKIAVKENSTLVKGTFSMDHCKT
ncbi:zinc finger protein OZF-like [Teleopsis dalmanni]|uniref:zinc finger protein OZF-like n=1 Tax=Teleopsis dalmanni TaxID=139649 RepID=UPI0018CE2686|nr:zinc finger protein OZF-like [Teleopsis dalmanni]